MNELTSPHWNLPLFKIIMVADVALGKPVCFTNKLTSHNEYKSEYNVTIGVEFSSKIIPFDLREDRFSPISLESIQSGQRINMLKWRGSKSSDLWT